MARKVYVFADGELSFRFAGFMGKYVSVYCV